MSEYISFANEILEENINKRGLSLTETELTAKQ